jgi:hypothetical protein
MRFKQFLEARVKPYDKQPLKDVDAIITALKEHCSDTVKAWANSGHRIWRGSRSMHNSGIFHPGTGERESENSSNYYTVLLDTNPLNSVFPKRSQSFIGSTSYKSANSYGHALVLFPYDQTKVGVVNRTDIWLCKLEFNRSLKINESLSGMNDFWEGFMKALGKGRNTPTMPELQKLLHSHPTVALKELHEASYVSRQQDNENIVDELADDLPNAYSFENMGCEVILPRELDAERSEVWFSGSCVGVAEVDWEAVRKEFKL